MVNFFYKLFNGKNVTAQIMFVSFPHLNYYHKERFCISFKCEYKLLTIPLIIKTNIRQHALSRRYPDSILSLRFGT